MTEVLIWKVYREQRSVWVGIAALAIGMLALHLTFLERDLPRHALGSMYVVVASIYGLMVGAILLAGEREVGTASFLEAQPATRLRIWCVKCLTGVFLVLTQVLFLWTIVLLTGGILDFSQGASLMAVLAGLAFLSFAWGLFASGRARTSLGAMLWAILGQVSSGAVAFGLWALTMSWRPELFSWCGEALPLVCFCGLVTEALMLGSWASEARLDRLRHAELIQGKRNASWCSQLAVLLWLSLRQASFFFRWLAIVAFLGGIFLPLESLLWPLLGVLTLLVGTIAGVLVFAGEQPQRTGRFLSEQRLPPGTVLLFKLGVTLILAVVTVSLILILLACRLAVLGMEHPSQFSLLIHFLPEYLQGFLVLQRRAR